MVNPGIFRGSRFIFLVGEKPAYKVGVEGGYTGDALAKIQSRYFQRYPVELALEAEPLPESLRAVDDEAPDAEQQEPDPEELTDVEYQAEVKRLLEHSDLINIRKAVSCHLFVSKAIAHDHAATQALVCVSVFEGLGS